MHSPFSLHIESNNGFNDNELNRLIQTYIDGFFYQSILVLDNHD